MNISTQGMLQERFGEVGQLVLFRATRTQYRNVAIYVAGRLNPRIASFLAYLHLTKNVLNANNFNGSTVRRICTHGSMIYTVDKSVIKGSITEMDLNGNIKFVPKNPVADGDHYTVERANVSTTHIKDIIKLFGLQHVPNDTVTRDNTDRFHVSISLPVPHTRHHEQDSVWSVEDTDYCGHYGISRGQVLAVTDCNGNIRLEVGKTDSSLFGHLISDTYVRYTLAYYIQEHLEKHRQQTRIYEVGGGGVTPLYSGLVSVLLPAKEEN